jgi:hypothetical protein
MPPLSPVWRAFVRRFTASNAYWYVPHGFAVKAEEIPTIAARLKRLEAFEGEKWVEAQRAYAADLRANGLYSGTGASGRPEALARMVKTVFEMLGVAWTDGEEAIYITDVGRRFLRAHDKRHVLERQLWRWQFWNPTVGGNAHRPIRLFPHVVLIEVLLAFADGITADEFCLFVARMLNSDDIEQTIAEIRLWREESADVQERVIEALLARRVLISPRSSRTGTRRTSLLRTIRHDRAYIWRWHGLPDYMETTEQRIRICPSAVNRVRDMIEDHRESMVLMDFDDRKDWVGWYGQYFKRPSDEAEAAQSEAARRREIGVLLKVLRRGTLRRLRSGDFALIHLLLREQDLEDYLARDMGRLEPGLVLVPNGRQFSTPAGRIDLLARDGASNWVIVELKRGRSSDRVVGQTLRYMGWADKALRSGAEEVRGIVVAREFDSRLAFSIEAARRAIKARLYDLGFTFSDPT